MTDEIAKLDDMVRLIDVILRDRAEQIAHREPWITADEALPLLWKAFERGEFYLIHSDDGERLGWEGTRTAVERFRLRRKHRRLVERWRETLGREVVMGPSPARPVAGTRDPGISLSNIKLLDKDKEDQWVSHAGSA